MMDFDAIKTKFRPGALNIDQFYVTLQLANGKTMETSFIGPEGSARRWQQAFGSAEAALNSELRESLFEGISCLLRRTACDRQDYLAAGGIESWWQLAEQLRMFLGGDAASGSDMPQTVCDSRKGIIMAKVTVSNIQWDIDFNDALERLDEMTDEKAAETLNVRTEEYRKLSEDERHDCAWDLWQHTPAALHAFMGLPDSVDVPEELLKTNDRQSRDDAISDWLSDEYGFCHNGFTLSDDEPEDGPAPG